MYFTNKGLQRLKTEIDLVSVIKKEIRLTKLSNGFNGRCPFCDYHNDLFVVTPEKNEWYCFGYCQQGGTIIDWYMKRKKIKCNQVYSNVRLIFFRNMRRVAQSGSALRSGRRGRRFKSSYADQPKKILEIYFL